MRQWLKIRMQDTIEASHAVEIVNYWRSLRSAAPHLTKAIRMYYALTQGDTSLLKQYFPLIGAAQPVEIERSAPPAKAAGNPKTREVQKSADEDMDDFMSSLGI